MNAFPPLSPKSWPNSAELFFIGLSTKLKHLYPLFDHDFLFWQRSRNDFNVFFFSFLLFFFYPTVGYKHRFVFLGLTLGSRTGHSPARPRAAEWNQLRSALVSLRRDVLSALCSEGNA